MQKIIVTAFYLLSTSFCSGQILSAEIKFHQYTFATTSAALGNNIYIDYFNGFYFDYWGTQSSILKLDNNLNIVDSVCLSCLVVKDTNVFGDTQLGTFSDSLLYVAFLSRTANYTFKTTILVLDTSLSLVNQFSIKFPLDTLRYNYEFQAVLPTDSVLYLAGRLDDTSSTNPDAYIIATDLNGNILYSYIIESDSVNYGPRFIQITSLTTVGSKIAATLWGTWSEYIAVFDKSLNFLGFSSQFPPNTDFQILPHISFVKNNKAAAKLQAITEIMDLTHIPLPDENKFYKNLSLLHLDSNFQLTARDTFAFTGWKMDTLNNFIESTKKGTATFGFSSEDTVVTMATDYTIFPTFWPDFEYFNIPTKTYISAFNTVNSTTLWSKVYANGIAHQAEEVVALSNNRWLLVFNEYDWNTYGQDNLAVRLIIIDGNGNPIGITENEEKALSQEPMVYPNPASTHLTIGNLHWPGNLYTYQLTDVKGALVLSGALPVSGQITLPEALNGVYVIAITNQTGFGWARKVVIE
jgi:hypothetical protein